MLPIVLRPDELQLGRGETIADTARALSLYLDALTVRTVRPGDGRGARGRGLDPGDQRPDRRPPPVPGPRRRDDAGGGVRLPRRPPGRVRRRRRQRVPLAHPGRRAWLGFELRDRDPAGLRAVERDRRRGPGPGRRDRRLDQPDPRSGRGRHGAPTPSTRTCGRRWATRSRARGTRRTAFAGFTVDAGPDAAGPTARRSSCTACPPTAARRSPTRSSTGRRRGSGRRPATGSTRRRRCCTRSSPATPAACSCR